MMEAKKSPKMLALRELMQELLDSGLLDDVRPEAEGDMIEEGDDYAMRDEEGDEEEAGDEEGEMMADEPKKVRMSITRLAAMPREEVDRVVGKGKGKRGRY